MNTISFMTANFVARQVGYKMTEGWGQGDKATNDHIQPIETFEERFGELLRDIRAMGFDSLDLWTAHLNWTWATPDHLSIATALLEKHALQVSSYAGGFGNNRDEFQAACKVARAVGARILGGGTPMLQTDRANLIAILKDQGLKLGIENHPEKTPEEMLEKIGDGGDGAIGTAIDTGWYGTQGYDAAVAVERLHGHIFHVHLKDVRAPGGHETCRYGEGCVPVEACVKTLQRLGYRGGYGVEHEPEHFDPTEDCKVSLAMLRAWLATE